VLAVNRSRSVTVCLEGPWQRKAYIMHSREEYKLQMSFDPNLKPHSHIGVGVLPGVNPVVLVGASRCTVVWLESNRSARKQTNQNHYKFAKLVTAVIQLCQS
jgi:hypothetical protein